MTPNLRATGLPAPMQAEQSLQHGAEDLHRHRRIILCVDDDPVVLYLQKVLLEAAGFQVLTAADSSGALLAFAAGTPDAVVLDYAMPGCSGAVLAARMRRIDDKIPVILNSGAATVTPADAALFDEVLPKGLAASQLVRVLHTLVPPSAPDEVLSRSGEEPASESLPPFVTRRQAEGRP